MYFTHQGIRTDYVFAMLHCLKLARNTTRIHASSFLN